MSELPKHKWVETADGSLTLFSEDFQEACHSTNGAKTETLLHYIGGCQVVERVGQHDPFVILEVGFGLGLGYETTREVLKGGHWKFISMELDRDLVEWWRQRHPGAVWVSDEVMRWENLTVFVGDAREVVPRLLGERVHAIYQDAFSPRRNPTLWTREWFEFLKSVSSPDVIMSTYSSSSSIRKSMLEAGWVLKRGEKFGPKRTSTRATLTGVSDDEILLHLERSPVSAITDGNTSDFRRK